MAKRKMFSSNKKSRYVSQADKDRSELIALVKRITIAFEKQVVLQTEKSKRENKIADKAFKMLTHFEKNFYKPKLK